MGEVGADRTPKSPRAVAGRVAPEPVGAQAGGGRRGGGAEARLRRRGGFHVRGDADTALRRRQVLLVVRIGRVHGSMHPRDSDTRETRDVRRDLRVELRYVQACVERAHQCARSPFREGNAKIETFGKKNVFGFCNFFGHRLDELRIPDCSRFCAPKKWFTS